MRFLIRTVPIMVLALAACTKGWLPTSAETDVAVLSGGPQGVVVGPARSAADARARSVADVHCRRHGLSAEWPRMIDTDKVHFICIQ